MNVSACLVTRGDVDMQPVLDSLPAEWEVVLWTNPKRTMEWPGVPELMGQTQRWPGGVAREPGFVIQGNGVDYAVYGRYAAIEYASHDLIYVQDDDVIVSDPQAVVDTWLAEYALTHSGLLGNTEADGKFVVCNMPQEFRHDGYTDSALVGFGAAFHREAPKRAFERFAKDVAGAEWPWLPNPDPFNRTCDVVFTTLTPRVLVDVPKQNREFAEDANRMYRQPDHVGERTQMLELARKVRDA